MITPRLLAEVADGDQGDDDQARREQRGKSGAERLEPGADAGLGGSEGEVQEVGDLLVSEIFEEGQAQRLSLGRRRRRDGRADDHAAVRAPGLLGRAGAGLGHAPEAEALGVRLDPHPPAAPAQLVEHAEVGDPQDPGAEGAPRRVEGAGLATDRHEDVLDDLLGGGAVDRLGRHVEDQRRVAAVERAERVLPAGGELAHQRLVAENRVRV